MKTVRWSVDAKNDLADIDDYLVPRNAEAAARMIGAAIDAADFLAQHPKAGPLVPQTRYRKWRVAGTPYILLYRPDGDLLRIVRVAHVARAWKRLL